MSRSFEEITLAPRAQARDGGPQAAGRAGAALARRGAGWTAIAVAALLTACGGGGGGGDASSPTVTRFPLRSPYQAFVQAGSSQTLSVTGPCTADAAASSSKPKDTTFESRPAKSVTNKLELLTSCVVKSADGSQSIDLKGASSGEQFFTSDYAPLGAVDSQGYSRYENPKGTLAAAPPAAASLPETVAVGESGTLGTQYTYTDATLAQRYAVHSTLGYKVVASSVPNEVLTQLIIDSYDENDPSGKPFRTQVNTYRLSLVTGLNLLTTEYVDSRFQNNLHLLLTVR